MNCVNKAQLDSAYLPSAWHVHDEHELRLRFGGPFAIDWFHCHNQMRTDGFVLPYKNELPTSTLESFPLDNVSCWLKMSTIRTPLSALRTNL